MKAPEPIQSRIVYPSVLAFERDLFMDQVLELIQFTCALRDSPGVSGEVWARLNQVKADLLKVEMALALEIELSAK